MRKKFENGTVKGAKGPDNSGSFFIFKKNYTTMLFGGLLCFSAFGCAQGTSAQEPMESIYDIALEGIDGKPGLSQYKGKKNSLCQCGLRVWVHRPIRRASEAL